MRVEHIVGQRPRSAVHKIEKARGVLVRSQPVKLRFCLLLSEPGVGGPERHGSDASRERRARRERRVDGMARARLRRGYSNDGRRVRPGSARLGMYGRPACRLHLSMPAKDRSVAGTRGDPVAVSFSCDSHDVIRVCEPCQGFVRRCKRCRRFHLVYQGQGGE